MRVLLLLLLLLVKVVGELQRKRTLAASRGFLAAARLSCSTSLLILFFIQPLSGNCYKLPSVVTFTFIQIFDHNFVFFTERREVSAFA